MNNRIFRGYLLIVLLAVFTNVNAQMRPATKLVLDADTVVTLNVKRSVVWDLVKNPAHWDKIYGSNASSFKSVGNLGDENGVEPNLEMEIVFKNGTKRNQKVIQITPEHRIIVLTEVNPPAGISENSIVIISNVDTENSSKLSYSIRVVGPEPAKAALLAQLKSEMKIFLEGLQMNIVPAVK